MKEERLIRLIGEIKEEFIEETAFAPMQKEKSMLFRSFVVAACVCLIIYTGVRVYDTGLHSNILLNPSTTDVPTTTEQTDNINDMHTAEAINKMFLTTPEYVLYETLAKINPLFESLGSGFSGVMFYNEEELLEYVGESEITDTNLPVYKNAYYSELIKMNVYLNEETLKELAEHVAVLMGETNIKVEGVFAYDSEYSIKECYGATAFSDNYDIYVSADGNIRVSFNEPVSVSEYNLVEEFTDEEAQDVLRYLEQSYSGLVDYKEPEYVYEAKKGDYRYDGTRDYVRKYSIIDKASGNKGINEDSIEFIPNDNGDLTGICINFPLAGKEWLGEYPIISEENAKEILLGQNYISNVPKEYLKDGKIYEEAVKAVALEYVTYKYSLPYYCFYVELDYNFNVAEGLKHYGIFYVPAIEEQYLENVELYNGQFN